MRTLSQLPERVRRVHPLTQSSLNADTITLDPAKYDQEQIHLMEERLILLDNDDRNVGEGSKKDCASTAHSSELPRRFGLTMRSPRQAT